MEDKYQYIRLGIAMGDLIKSTLGPSGMNKMVIGDDMKPISTNDGATVIKNLKVDNPIAQMFKALALSQERAIGDGTTTAVLFSAQLLSHSIDLLEKGMHRINVVNGYNIARQAALEFIQNKTLPVDTEKVMLTTFGSKIPPELAKHLKDLLIKKDFEKIKIYEEDNSDPMDTTILSGAAFEGFTINDRMPRKAEGKVAVVDMKTNLENTKMAVQSSEELVKVNRQFRKFKKDLVEKLKKEEVKALFITDINEELSSLLSEANILTVVSYKREDLDNICAATGAIAIADPEEDFSKFLGKAIIEYSKEKKSIYVENESSDIETLVLRGQTKEVLEETHRAVDDVIGIMKRLGPIVVGAGAIETEVSLFLRKFATQVGGKEQMAIEKFANAIEAIPLTLAKNCGLDALDVIARLRSHHTKGEKYTGVDAVKGISDAKERNILELAILKAHAISAATDVANLILKLDDIYQGGSGENNNPNQKS